MSVTIIKGGKNEFLGHCKWCGCDFRYTADCVGNDDNIGCPFCQRRLRHLGESGTEHATHWFGHAAYATNHSYAAQAQASQQAFELQKGLEDWKKREGKT